MEYVEIVKFVKQLASTDSRFYIINNKKHIHQTLDKVGYPFKSKEHSLYVEQYQKQGMKKYIQKYLDGKEYAVGCPLKLRYNFTEHFDLHVSSKCCDEFKKKPLHEWQKANKKPIAIIGVRMSEGGTRRQHKNCITMKNGKLSKFAPLNPISNEFEKWYIDERNIKLCDLYHSPYNLTRTGCVGCPYNLELQKDLDVMAISMPQTRKQCELLWGKVYEEYRRIGYRLVQDTGQLSLYDIYYKERK